MKFRVIASLVTAACLAVAGTANASSIGLFFSSDGSDCDGSVPAFASPTNVYVLAILGGDAAAAGITGAEFRVEGHQGFSFSAWVVNPEAQNTSVGNPLMGGANVAFPTCKTGGMVLLGTVQLAHFAGPVPPQDVTMRVDRHSMPTNPMFPCSLLVLCDNPVFTKICVPGGEAFVNSPRNCTVSVTEKSWSQVKNLFN